MPAPNDFFNLSSFAHKGVFEGCDLVWEPLKKLRVYIKKNLDTRFLYPLNEGKVFSKNVVFHDGEIYTKGFKIKSGSPIKGDFSVTLNGKILDGATIFYAGSCIFDGDVHIGEGSVVEPGALIKGPTIIGRNSEIRQGAYIRGSCLIGDRCIVGHATEMKNAVMLDRVTAGHFAYIGDSILGNNVNLGAGTKLANLNIIGTEIQLRIENKPISTGLKKMGAILGDSVQTGCNSVTSPGTLLGKRSVVVPNATVPSGYHRAKTIIR